MNNTRTKQQLYLTGEVYLLAQSKLVHQHANLLNAQNSIISADATLLWCRVTENHRNVAICTFRCVMSVFATQGICGETVPAKNVVKELDDDFFGESVKLKGKALRNLGDQDYY
jgi:hypothetical protein